MAGQEYQALAHAQQRILHGELFHPGTNFANLVLAMNLPADSNMDVLAQAINAVIDSNDALRLQLKIDEASGLSVQYIAEYHHQQFQLIDFADKEGLNEWIKGKVDQPFVLYDQPLFRILLARCQGRVTLLLVAHHVICDNGSLYHFMRQVAENYSNIESGREVTAGRTSYFDYLATEIAYLQSEDCQQDRAFWHEKF